MPCAAGRLQQCIRTKGREDCTDGAGREQIFFATGREGRRRKSRACALPAQWVLNGCYIGAAFCTQKPFSPAVLSLPIATPQTQHQQPAAQSAHQKRTGRRNRRFAGRHYEHSRKRRPEAFRCPAIAIGAVQKDMILPTRNKTSPFSAKNEEKQSEAVSLPLRKAVEGLGSQAGGGGSLSEGLAARRSCCGSVAPVAAVMSGSM